MHCKSHYSKDQALYYISKFIAHIIIYKVYMIHLHIHFQQYFINLCNKIFIISSIQIQSVMTPIKIISVLRNGLSLTYFPVSKRNATYIIGRTEKRIQSLVVLMIRLKKKSQILTISMQYLSTIVFILFF